MKASNATWLASLSAEPDVRFLGEQAHPIIKDYWNNVGQKPVSMVPVDDNGFRYFVFVGKLVSEHYFSSFLALANRVLHMADLLAPGHQGTVHQFSALAQIAAKVCQQCGFNQAACWWPCAFTWSGCIASPAMLRCSRIVHCRFKQGA